MSLEAGFDAHLTKPADPDAFLELLAWPACPACHPEMKVPYVHAHRPGPEGAGGAGHDAAALTRGGGQSAYDLGGDGVIEAVAASPIPVLVALVDASDDQVVACVADASFPTPTALGAWLRDAVERKRGGRDRQRRRLSSLALSSCWLNWAGSKRLSGRWCGGAPLPSPQRCCSGATLAWLLLHGP